MVRTAAVLGKGGEGTVFHVDGDASIAAKIYTDGKHLDRRDKVSTMVANALHSRSSLAAFPIDTLHANDTGDFVGFTMKKVGGVRPIHELYSPGSRRIEFPKADFRFLARAATNVSKAIASVHQAGCVVGDINHSGILVSDQATITLIDADSFQVQSGSIVYRCRVGVAEYTPPELAGKLLETVDRDPSHDAFGLGVILFQLLFMGRHPYAGRYSGQEEMPIEKAIKEGRFAYSIARKSETSMVPPPFASGLGDVTPELASAFERAFAANPSQYRSRPTAAEWIDVLGKFEASLVTCRHSRSHHHSSSATSCPWCRMENGTGAILFVPSSSVSNAATTGKSFDLTAAINAIKAVAGPGPAPDPEHRFTIPTGLQKSQAAMAASVEHDMRRIIGALVGCLAVGFGLVGFVLAFLGVFIAAFLLRNTPASVEALKGAKANARREWDQAVKEWQWEVGPHRFEQMHARLLQLAAEYETLPAQEQVRLDELNRNRQQVQLRRFLEGHLIVRAKIPGIGDGRKATLRSFGIENAYDVSSSAVRQVPGFGEAMTKRMLDWRKSIERRFVFNSAIGVDASAIHAVKAEIAKKRDQIETQLVTGVRELANLSDQISNLQLNPTQRLKDAYRAWKQAEIDCG
nr:hypothetical protein [Niveispirillum sp. BGYR6]